MLARVFTLSHGWSELPCVRPVDAALFMAAGHNALRRSGPGQKYALDWRYGTSGLSRSVDRDKYRDMSSVYIGRILAYMAGAEAEKELLGRVPVGDGDDQFQIAMMADRGTDLSDEQWERYEPRMRRQTRRLVRKHRSKIERIAAALEEHGKLQAHPRCRPKVRRSGQEPRHAHQQDDSRPNRRGKAHGPRVDGEASAVLVSMMSALPPKAEVARRRWHFRFVPMPDVFNFHNSRERL